MSTETSDSHAIKSQEDERDNEAEEDQIILELPPPPPDGGYGWVIVLCSFINVGIVAMSPPIFGALFNEYTKYFDEPKSKMTLAGSLVTGLLHLMGPVASFFTNRHGCRPVIMVGAIFSAALYALSTISPNGNVFIVIYALIGVSNGLIIIPSTVSVSHYFEDKRAIATSIAACGPSVGVFVTGPLSLILQTKYGWKGANIGFGLIFLICLVFGGLTKPLKAVTVPRKERKKILRKLSQKENSSVSSSTSTLLFSSAWSRKLGLSPKVTFNSNVSNIRGVSEDVETISEEKKHVQATTENTHQLEAITECAETEDNNRDEAKRSSTNIEIVASTAKLKDHHMKQSEIPHRQSVHKFNPLADIEVETETTENTAVCGIVHQSFFNILTEMVGISVLKNLAFLLIGISNFLAFIGFYFPFFFITDAAVEKGVDAAEATLLLSVIGIANCVGRGVSGFLTTLPGMSVSLVHNLGMLFCGILVVCIGLMYEFLGFACCAAFFAFFSGTFVALTSVILVDLVGLEKLTSACGLVFMFRGAASIIGSPLAELRPAIISVASHSLWVVLRIGITYSAYCHPILYGPYNVPFGLAPTNPNGAVYDASGGYMMPFFLGGSFIILGSAFSFGGVLLKRYQE